MKWLTFFFKTFLPETKAEMKKVTFPSRNEVVSTTIVVIIASFIFAFYLWIADLIILWLYEGLNRWLT